MKTVKSRILALTAATAVATAMTFVPVTVSSVSTISTASAASYYPTKAQTMYRYRVRAAYPAAGRRDPCRDVWAFPSRYDQTAISQCGDPH
jgi:hypothetical protein